MRNRYYTFLFHTYFLINKSSTSASLIIYKLNKPGVTFSSGYFVESAKLASFSNLLYLKYVLLLYNNKKKMQSIKVIIIVMDNVSMDNFHRLRSQRRVRISVND